MIGRRGEVLPRSTNKGAGISRCAEAPGMLYPTQRKARNILEMHPILTSFVCVCLCVSVFVCGFGYACIHRYMVARGVSGQSCIKKALPSVSSTSSCPESPSLTEVTTWRSSLLAPQTVGVQGRGWESLFSQRFPPRLEDGCIIAPAFLFRHTGPVYFSPV